MKDTAIPVEVTVRGLIDWTDFDLNIDRIPNLFTSRHAMLLYGLVGWLRPKIAVEIGAWNGHCTARIARALIENGDGGVLWAIDDFSLGNQATALHNNLAALGVANAVMISPGKSTEAVWPEQVDFAFIDGDHSTEGCLHDVRKAIELGATCVVIHDTYSWWGPREFAQWAETAHCDLDQGWYRMEGMFDEGLLVLLKKEPRPDCTYTKDKYPDGIV